MNDTTTTLNAALEIYFDESVTHFDMSDAQLAKRIMKCLELGRGTSMNAAIARNIGSHARDLLRSRQAVAGCVAA